MANKSNILLTVSLSVIWRLLEVCSMILFNYYFIRWYIECVCLDILVCHRAKTLINLHFYTIYDIACHSILIINCVLNIFSKLDNVQCENTYLKLPCKLSKKLMITCCFFWKLLIWDFELRYPKIHWQSFSFY